MNKIILSLFLVIFSLGIVAAQNKKETLKKEDTEKFQKGELYYVVVGDKLKLTKDIFSTIKKEKVKMVISGLKFSKKQYQLDKKLSYKFDKLEPLDRDYLLQQVVCNCNEGDGTVEVCCMGDIDSCDKCCGLFEDLTNKVNHH